MTVDLRALTLIRPMSAAIVHGTKRVENRPQDLPKAMRGKDTVVAVHAGKGWDGDYCRTVRDIDGGIGKDQRQGVRILDGTPYEAHIEDVGIVGLMRLTGRVYRHEDVDARTGQPRDNDDVNLVRRYVLDSDVDFEHVPYPGPWYSGPFGYEIAEATAFPEPIPCRGMLGFWRVPETAIAAMRAQVNRHGVDRMLEELFYRAVGETWPCLECGSKELCEPDCHVVPWSQGPRP